MGSTVELRRAISALGTDLLNSFAKSLFFDKDFSSVKWGNDNQLPFNVHWELLKNTLCYSQALFTFSLDQNKKSSSQITATDTVLRQDFMFSNTSN